MYVAMEQNLNLEILKDNYRQKRQNKKEKRRLIKGIVCGKVIKNNHKS